MLLSFASKQEAIISSNFEQLESDFAVDGFWAQADAYLARLSLVQPRSACHHHKQQHGLGARHVLPIILHYFINTVTTQKQKQKAPWARHADPTSWQGG